MERIYHWYRLPFLASEAKSGLYRCYISTHIVNSNNDQEIQRGISESKVYVTQKTETTFLML